jgi:soluble cytochrome b562
MRHRSSWVVGLLNVSVFTLGLMLGVTSFPGCGSKSEKTSSDKTQKNNSGSKTTGNQNVAANGAPRSSKELWTNSKGQKMWGKHPYDIWHEDAYSVARNTTAVGGNSKKTPMGTGTGKKDPMPKKAAKSTDDWQSIAPVAILDAEVKRVRNFVTQKFQTVGRYNGGYKEIQYHAATLAAIAKIAATHPDKVSWKDNALYIRDLGTSINAASDGLGKKKFDAAKITFEQLVDILNGNKPADSLKKPVEAVTFDIAADRGGLMKRMDEAHQWLQKEVRDEAIFKEENETILHEATILAILSKVITDSSYDSTDEKEYQDFAKNMVTASNTMVAAAKSGNFKSYRTAVDTIINNCNNCHTNYKE